jgi:hypothetical protein
MILAVAISFISISSEIREDSSFRDHFDLLKFRFVDAKKFRHFDYLIRTYKVRRISAKLLQYSGRCGMNRRHNANRIRK